MEFDKFFRLLHKNIDSYSLYDLVAELFIAANDTVFLTSDMVANWFKGNNRSYRKQLMDGKNLKPFDDKGFVQFLKSHTNSSWVKIQEQFKNEPNKNHMIDCITTDHDTFLYSVMIQFKEIIGYPYERTHTLDKRIQQTGTPLEQMVKILEAAIFDCDLISILNGSPSATQEAIDFLGIIQSDIENNQAFFDYRNEEIFQNIVAFAYAVDQYNRVLNTREHSVISFYPILDIEINAIWRRIVALYSEICGANTLFGDKPPI